MLMNPSAGSPALPNSFSNMRARCSFMSFLVRRVGGKVDSIRNFERRKSWRSEGHGRGAIDKVLGKDERPQPFIALERHFAARGGLQDCIQSLEAHLSNHTRRALHGLVFNEIRQELVLVLSRDRVAD